MSREWVPLRRQGDAQDSDEAAPDWVPVNPAGDAHGQKGTQPGWVRVPAPPGPVVQERTFRPSLLAALEVPVNVLVFLGFLFLPFLVGSAVVARDPLVLILPGFVVGLLNFFPAFFAALAPAFQILFTRYTIDEDGVRVTTKFFTKRESRVSWAKITALQHRRTVVDRVCGIERLDIVAYGARGTTLHLVGLRNAAEIRNLVAQKMRAYATVEALFSND